MDELDTRARDIDAALETASWCRLQAGLLRQTGFAPEYVRWLINNAKAAERWATHR